MRAYGRGGARVGFGMHKPVTPRRMEIMCHLLRHVHMVAQMVHEEEGNGDLSEDVEAGALTWGLFALGGLGAASCGALGADACER